MDYLISSGGCPTISGNLNNMYSHITQEQLHKYHEETKKQFLQQLEEYQKSQNEKMCYVEPEIREPRPLRPKPTPAPPKNNIQGAPVDLISHYEKLVDRLEREIERLTSELEKVRNG